MMPLDWLRLGGYGIVLCLLGYGEYCVYDYGVDSGIAKDLAKIEAIQNDYDSYKSNINDQVEKSKQDAAKIKEIQDAKYTRSQVDYAESSDVLNNALTRLRNAQAMSGQSSVPVAGGSTCSLPSKAENTGEAASSVKVGTGVLTLDQFYEAAMRDTDQCKRLIDFVK